MPARKTATRRKTAPASASQPNNNQQTWLNQVYNHARALRGLLNTAAQSGISNAQVSSLKDVIIDIHDLCFPGMNPAIHYTQTQPNARGSNMPALPTAAVTGTKAPLQQQQPAPQRRQPAARSTRRAARGTGGRQRFRLRSIEKQQGLTFQQAYDQRVANGERPAPLTQDQINQSSQPMRMTGS